MAELQPSCSEDGPKEPRCLSDAQRARIERNRQKALLLKQARLTSRPYTLDRSERNKNVVKAPPKIVDTGGGFLLEEEEEDNPVAKKRIVHEAGAILDPELLICEGCNKVFTESFLNAKFDHPVCDGCKDLDAKHVLITKSEAKEKYLLKDEDLEKRDPALKFILRKNPHNPRWGDMKLYLDIQVHKRALEIWESEEKIEEDRERRIQNKERTKQKKFDKKVKDLRMAVRSSLWKKDLGPHEHIYGEETYNEEDDNYTKECSTCGHVMSYEKM